MAAEKLSWEQIKKLYDHEWVLLDNFDWPEEQEYPKAGIVVIHAKKRAEFDRLIAAREAGFDSALIFVGEPDHSGDEISSRECSRIEYSES